MTPTQRKAIESAIKTLEFAAYVSNRSGLMDRCEKAADALRAALAEADEPVQAPVAWRYKPMIGSPWSISDDGYYISCKRDNGYIVEALYTHPPRREPLTEEQIDTLCMGSDGLPTSHIEFARAIEKAHGIGDSDG